MYYPFYPFDGGYFIESDYTEIRLAEIIYSHILCKFFRTTVKDVLHNCANSLSQYVRNVLHSCAKGNSSVRMD